MSNQRHKELRDADDFFNVMKRAYDSGMRYYASDTDACVSSIDARRGLTQMLRGAIEYREAVYGFWRWQCRPMAQKKLQRLRRHYL